MLEADGMRVHRLSTLKYVEVSKMVQDYCVKDRKMVEMKNAKEITLKNGRPAMQGECPECGTKVTRIGASK